MKATVASGTAPTAPKEVGSTPPRPPAGETEARLAEAEATIAHLNEALASSRVIGAAIGMIMAEHQMTRDEAFTALQRLSMARNVKLRQLAERVVGDHEASLSLDAAAPAETT